MTVFGCIIFLKNWIMISNFKFIPYSYILQNFVQNVRKPKWPSILSWYFKMRNNFCNFLQICKNHSSRKTQISTRTQYHYIHSILPFINSTNLHSIASGCWVLKYLLLFLNPVYHISRGRVRGNIMTVIYTLVRYCFDNLLQTIFEKWLKSEVGPWL